MDMILDKCTFQKEFILFYTICLLTSIRCPYNVQITISVPLDDFNNSNVDLVSINSYIKFGQNFSRY